MTTPQSPAGDPYGAQQSPMGQSPMGQSPMGPAGGSGGKLAAGAGKLVIRVVVAVVALAIVGAIGLYINRDKPAQAKTGDCLSGQNKDEFEIADCTSEEATYKVVGRIESMAESDWNASDNPCSDYPTAEQSYWEGDAGKTGYVLCLEPMAK